MGEHEMKESIVDRIAEYRKAIAAFLVPALVVLVAALAPDSAGIVEVTLAEWVGIVIAALGTGAAVATIPNEISVAKKEEVIMDAVADPNSPVTLEVGVK